MDIDVNKTAHYDSLKDRVVIITGGGQGIGRGFAHHFAAQGAIPVVADLDGANAETVAGEVKDGGGRALGLRTDVSSEADANALAEAALSAFGRIDCLINNAAVFSKITMAPFWELPVDEWKSAMDVNITVKTGASEDDIARVRDGLAKYCPLSKVIKAADTELNENWTIERP